MYKHYIRIDENNIIVHGFSDAFEAPLENDIVYIESEHRHFIDVFTLNILNERNQYAFKYIEGNVIERSKQELDDEWNNKPKPRTEVDVLQEENAFLTLELLVTQMQLEEVENEQAKMLLSLLENGGDIMNWFETVKRHYDAGRYTKDQVKLFVVGGKITPAEYKLITGDDYE